MSDLFPTTIDDEIAELEREIVLRRRVYPRWMAQGKITKVKADRQIAIMESAVSSLNRLKALSQPA